jgi:hypothetical protein
MLQALFTFERKFLRAVQIQAKNHVGCISCLPKKRSADDFILPGPPAHHFANIHLVLSFQSYTPKPTEPHYSSIVGLVF